MADSASMSISLPISRGFADVEAIYEQLELTWGNPNCSSSTILVYGVGFPFLQNCMCRLIANVEGEYLWEQRMSMNGYLTRFIC